MTSLPPVEFLNVTFYAGDIGPLRAFYHDFLGLAVDYEQPGHIAAMGKVCAHDPSEGPVGTVRLYFLCDDSAAYAEAATAAGYSGELRQDGFGNPAWETTDPFGNSVVILQRGRD